MARLIVITHIIIIIIIIINLWHYYSQGAAGLHRDLHLLRERLHKDEGARQAGPARAGAVGSLHDCHYYYTIIIIIIIMFVIDIISYYHYWHYHYYYY